MFKHLACTAVSVAAAMVCAAVPHAASAVKTSATA